MDINALIITLIAILSPYAKTVLDKTVETLAEKTAEEGFKEREAIWETVKGFFKRDELTLLNIFKDADTDEKTKNRLEGVLEERLLENPDLAIQLELLIKEFLEKVPQQTAHEAYNVEVKDNAKVGAAIGKGDVKGDAFAGDKITGDKVGGNKFEKK
jgi:hypothetical protein